MTCTLPYGVRDAIHVPFVVAKVDKKSFRDEKYNQIINPGDWVKFTDSSFNKVVPSTKKGYS